MLIGLSIASDSGSSEGGHSGNSNCIIVDATVTTCAGATGPSCSNTTYLMVIKTFIHNLGKKFWFTAFSFYPLYAETIKYINLMKFFEYLIIIGLFFDHIRYYFKIMIPTYLFQNNNNK